MSFSKSASNYRHLITLPISLLLFSLFVYSKTANASEAQCSSSQAVGSEENLTKEKIPNPLTVSFSIAIYNNILEYNCYLFIQKSRKYFF